MNGTPDRKICVGRVGATITEPPMITGGPEVNNSGLITSISPRDNSMGCPRDVNPQLFGTSHFCDCRMLMGLLELKLTYPKGNLGTGKPRYFSML